MAKKKTPKTPANRAHADFAREYVTNGYNATEAYRTVYKTVNDATAQANSHRLLRNAKVLELIDAEQAKVRRRRDLTRQRVLEELSCSAFLDPGSLYEKDGTLIPVDQLPEPVRRAIGSLENDELFDGVGKEREKVGVTRKVKLQSKLRALELIGKELGMFKDRSQVEHEGSVEVIVDTGVSRIPGEDDEDR